MLRILFGRRYDIIDIMYNRFKGIVVRIAKFPTAPKGRPPHSMVAYSDISTIVRLI